MSKNLGAIPSGRRISSLSSPQLVQVIRRLTADAVVYKLKNDGRESPRGPLLRAAMDEADRRNITIQHPENNQ